MKHPYRYIKSENMDSPYDNEKYFERQKILELRAELDVDEDTTYTLKELMEMKDEQE